VSGDAWNIAFFRGRLTPEPSDPLTPQVIQNSNIGKSYWDVGISKIPIEFRYRAAIQNIVTNLHVEERQGKGAIFYGDFGHGKTSSAVICLKAAMARGGQAYFEEAINLKRAHDKPIFCLTPEGIPVWDMVTKCHFVVIDDLGNETVTSGYEAGDHRVIESLIRARYNNRLPTYFTTNWPLEKLLTQYAGVASILTDLGRFRLVEVKGESWRRNSK